MQPKEPCIRPRETEFANMGHRNQQFYDASRKLLCTPGILKPSVEFSSQMSFPPLFCFFQHCHFHTNLFTCLSFCCTGLFLWAGSVSILLLTHPQQPASCLVRCYPINIQMSNWYPVNTAHMRGWLNESWIDSFPSIPYRWMALYWYFTTSCYTWSLIQRIK